MNAINSTGECVMSLPTFTGKPVIVLSASQPWKVKSALADIVAAICEVFSLNQSNVYTAR